jgi:6-phosphogluconolactonase
MVALAARGDVPWDRIEWYWADERVVAPEDPRSNVRLARESLLAPRGIAPRASIRRRSSSATQPRSRPRIRRRSRMSSSTSSSLGVGTNGHVASLMPGCAALAASGPVAPVPVEEVSEEPIVARVTITPPVLGAARRVIVAVAGENKAGVVAAAMRDPPDPSRVPAQLVRPSERVTWCGRPRRRGPAPARRPPHRLTPIFRLYGPTCACDSPRHVAHEVSDARDMRLARRGDPGGRGHRIARQMSSARSRAKARSMRSA